MARNELVRYAFNRGVISPLALARVDLKRAAFSAEQQENWMPRTLGPMMLRPGLGHIGSSSNNATARHIEFVRSLASMHILEFTAQTMRVWTNDALLTRATTSAAVANGTFAANLASWTQNDEAGGTSAWTAGGYMGLTGNGTAAAIRDQVVAIGAYAGVEHALRVVVYRGPVTIRVGSAAGLDDYVQEATLGSGTHSLSFTPAGSFNIRFMSRLKQNVLVDSVAVEAAGVVSLPTPYLATDLDNIRGGTDSLSVDVMFIGCIGWQPRRIERRNSGRSWSVVLYAPDDGPYRIQNTSTQTLTPSVLSGNGTLTSSLPFFKTGHVGALFRVGSTGQTVTKSMTLLNDATNSIRVVGILTDRTISMSLVGMTAGRTVVLEYSTDNATWIAWPGAGYSFTADAATSLTDGLNNQIIYYRLRCSVAGAAGATTATLSIPTGTIIGIGRVTDYTSTTVVNIEVLTDFGATTASANWVESLWSDYRGWPSAGALYEGRMIWGGFDAVAGSVSDAFDDFNPDTIGDSGPINRTIGSGPMDAINWVLPLQRLILGAQLGEHSVRSNAFDEPLTPTNFNRKRCSGQGSSNVQALTIDSRGLYVQRGGTRVFEIAFDQETYDYGSKDITILNPEICKPQVKRMAIQRRPDTRLHCVLSDGTAAVLVYDHAEQTMCWIKVTTDGAIEDVVTLPGVAGSEEDQVYYSVARSVNGATVRYLEKWAAESDCQGGVWNMQADSFVAGSGAIAVPHLEGKTVVAWLDGTCPEDANGNIQTYVVTGGTITPGGAAHWVVGLPYTALFKSAKLGQTLSKQKNIDRFAPVLYNTHAKGFWYGADFTLMDNLPLMYKGAPVDPNLVYPSYDEQDQEFPGLWDADTRLCLKAQAPRPCTVLAAVIDGQVL